MPSVDVSRLVLTLKGARAKLSPRVIDILNSRYDETYSRLSAHLDAARTEAAQKGLVQIGTKDTLQVIYSLVEAGKSISDPKFLTQTDPERAGLLCCNAAGAYTVVTSESVEPLFKEGFPECNGLFLALGLWRSAIKVWWAAELVQTFSRAVSPEGALNLLPITGDGELLYDSDGVMGSRVELRHMTDSQLERLASIAGAASFGSVVCEQAVTGAVYRWCRQLSVDSLMKWNIPFDIADSLIRIVGGSGSFKTVLEADWSPLNKGYGLVLWVSPIASLDYRDGVCLPTEAVANLVALCNEAEQESLGRLILRNWWRKAQELLHPSLVDDDI